MGDHLAAFPNRRARIQHFAILVLVTRGAAFVLPPTAGMFVKEISGERHAIANAAANDIANRAADGLADDVQAGNLERRIRAVVPVERILAWHEKRLASIAWTLSAVLSRARHFPIEAGKLEWVPANTQLVGCLFKGSPRAFAPRRSRGLTLECPHPFRVPRWFATPRGRAVRTNF